MDVLSDVIASMRAGTPSSALVSWHAPWGQRFPSMPGSAGFQIILQGSCWLVPPSGQPTALNVGDLLFFPHGHGYGLADSPSTVLADPVCDPMEDPVLFTSGFVGQNGPVTMTLCGGYGLTADQAHPLLADLPEVIHLPARPGHHHKLRTAIGLLTEEVGQPGDGADTAVIALLDMLLIYILRAWLSDQPPQAKNTSWAAALADIPVSAALHAMHQNPAHAWTVQSLAERATLSRATFSHRFTTLVGQPPLTYLTWWRMTAAARLLRESDAPLSEVAVRVGYASEFAFANAFKREYGIAPGRYRRNHAAKLPGSVAAGDRANASS